MENKKSSTLLPDDIVALSSDKTPVSNIKEQIVSAYGNFSAKYDKDMVSAGYKANEGCATVFHENAQKYFPGKEKELRIIDLGCGTGFLAEKLIEYGYTDIDGIDATQSMLDLAKKKNLYKNLFCAYLSSERIAEIPDNTYDVMVSSAAFGPGHVKSDTFDEVLRWMKKGGLLCFTVRKDSFEDPQLRFKEKFTELERDGKWKFVADTKKHNMVHERVKEYSNTYNQVLVYAVL